MKKKLFAALLALSMLLLAACGGASTGSQAEEDGQNPVMNFVGEYFCDRASILVEAEGTENAKFTVTWGGSYNESAQWVMSGKFEEEELRVYYQDGVLKNLTYGSDGQVTKEEEVYTGGHGFFFFHPEDNTLTWQDDQENRGEGMVFTYGVPAGEAEETGAELGSGEQDYYNGVSAMDKTTLEQSADKIRTAYLNEDWAALAGLIRYPITINETQLQDADAFLRYMSDKTVDSSDWEAMANETCHDMFYNGQGLCMGTGQIWLLDPSYMTEEEPELQIIAISGIVTR